MKYILNLCTLVAIAMLSIVIANAQTGSNANKHYEKDGLAFDYPEGWELTNSSSEGVQTVTLARKKSGAQMVVSTHDGLAPTCDFQSRLKKIAAGLTEKIAAQISAGAAPGTLPATTQIGGSDVAGVQLKGVVNRKPVTGAVYSFRLNRRFVSLSYILAANDERVKSAWNTVRTTLTIGPSVLTVMGTRVVDSSEPVSSGVLNGRAVALPRPNYPKIARSAHAAGTVTVQVTIDETGNVISAHAVSGHPLLRGVSVTAARQAKFSPTKLCGEPVRVTGVITYNFVAQ